MSWRDRLGPAKFRTAEFFVDVVERTGGRRGISHEYPLRDEPFVEDMGRKARSFPVDGYVLGADYIKARDALLDALEKAGSGELQHPYYGLRRVQVIDYHVRESSEEGGVARFSITFAETTARPAQPASTVDATGKALSSAASVRDAAGTEFLTKYLVGKLLSSVNQSLTSFAAKVSAVVAPLDLDVQARAAFASTLDSLTASVETVATVPADILSSVTDIVGLFESSAASLLQIYSYDPGVRPPATTPGRLQEQTNFDAVQWLVQRLVVARAAELLVAETFDSYEASTAARDALTDLIDDQANVAPDDTYPALIQLRADVVKAVPGTGQGLPHLLPYTPVSTLPALVIAYQLYGDVTLEADLVARNAVQRPGFIVGGQALEVLSHA